MVAVQGKEAADAASKRVRHNLGKASLVQNTEESYLAPTQFLTWLEFIETVTDECKVKVLKENLEALQEAILPKALTS